MRLWRRSRVCLNQQQVRRTFSAAALRTRLALGTFRRLFRPRERLYESPRRALCARGELKTGRLLPCKLQQPQTPGTETNPAPVIHVQTLRQIPPAPAPAFRFLHTPPPHPTSRPEATTPRPAPRPFRHAQLQLCFMAPVPQIQMGWGGGRRRRRGGGASWPRDSRVGPALPSLALIHGVRSSPHTPLPRSPLIPRCTPVTARPTRTRRRPDHIGHRRVG